MEDGERERGERERERECEKRTEREGGRVRARERERERKGERGLFSNTTRRQLSVRVHTVKSPPHTRGENHNHNK